MKKILKKKTTVVALVLLFIVIATLRFLSAHVQYTGEYKEMIYPSQNDGYSMRNVTHNESFDFEENTRNIYLSLRPGDSYQGSLILKNHEGKDREYRLSFQPIKSNEESNEVAVDSDRSILQFEEDIVYLEPKEFKQVSYTLNVPEDLEEGEYFVPILMHPLDQELGDANVKIVAAVGIKLYLEVTDNPQDYEYNMVLSDPEELAFKKVMYELRIFISVLFGILALVFMLKAFLHKK